MSEYMYVCILYRGKDLYRTPQKEKKFRARLHEDAEDEMMRGAVCIYRKRGDGGMGAALCAGRIPVGLQEPCARVCCIYITLLVYRYIYAAFGGPTLFAETAALDHNFIIIRYARYSVPQAF